MGRSVHGSDSNPTATKGTTIVELAGRRHFRPPTIHPHTARHTPDIPDELIGLAKSVIDRTVIVRRVYNEPLATDGTRVLVNRIWPHGLSKDRAQLNEWCKAVAPSTARRKWYGHVPELFCEFTPRYTGKLQDPDRAAALKHLHDL